MPNGCYDNKWNNAFVVLRDSTTSTINYCGTHCAGVPLPVVSTIHTFHLSPDRVTEAATVGDLILHLINRPT